MAQWYQRNSIETRKTFSWRGESMAAASAQSINKAVTTSSKRQRESVAKLSNGVINNLKRNVSTWKKAISCIIMWHRNLLWRINNGEKPIISWPAIVAYRNTLRRKQWNKRRSSGSVIQYQWRQLSAISVHLRNENILKLINKLARGESYRARNGNGVADAINAISMIMIMAKISIGENVISI